MSRPPVRIWRQTVTIPTYGIGAPDPNPMFLEKRVYQGSSGAVYPHPVIDRIDDEKHDRDWAAVFIENEYLKIMVLPELGGRVQMALDKTNDYHFVYYNRVIKPALVGLAGPWISGGIEFNWPQHHRPNTFGPVDCTLAENPDGSATVWCSEIDRMHGTKGMHGLTLRPGRACLEINVQLDNRTDLPQTFLWWANPAIHVDDHHQSIFPPDVHAVMDHGKRDVSSFPIATGTYYKVDYAPGTDISRYRNIPVPTSYMAYHSDYNFVGSYDHGRGAGLLHVCNHHVSPGKKQWTWGKGEFGYAWDRHLTDEDGPYIELMCGVYTDNQPDFSWLAPGERKSFTQFFMPYKGVGIVHNATTEAAVGLEVGGDSITVRVYTTAEYPGAKLTLTHHDRPLINENFDGSPREHFEATVAARITDQTRLRLVITDAAGRELVSYQPRCIDRDNIPEPAKAIDAPAQLDTVESLYLAGLHLEQYRHATREPADYYHEGLRRDPGDARCNNAMGLLLLRRGCFDEAEPHFRRAIQRLTRHNPNPADGEAFYNLGLCLEAQRRFDEAFDAYYKATWSAAQQDAAYFALARLACRRRDTTEALEFVDRCLVRNGEHLRAIHLKAHLLDAGAARQWIDQALHDDRFNFGVLYEQARHTGDWSVFDDRLRDEPENYLELACDCMAFGDDAGAIQVLEHGLHRHAASRRVFCYLADLYRRTDQPDKADRAARFAASAPPDATFANRLRTLAVLESAILADPADAIAPYELGNLYYDKRQHDRAIALWQRSRDLNPSFPTVHRNLGLAYFNKQHDPDAAWASFERAFVLAPADARVLFELDQLAKRLAHAPAARLERLAAHRGLVDQRDDLYLEYIALLNVTYQHQAALDMILARRFHPWEGGEGKVPAQYVFALTQLAREAIDQDHPDAAIELLHRAQNWPHSLGEGKLIGIQENNIHHLLGLAHRQRGEESAAVEAFEKAAVGLTEPTSAMYYNDQPPDMIFYQGLAQRALGREREATMRFDRLLAFGRQHVHDHVTIDYFAVSLPDFLVFDEDLDRRNQIHCLHMMALGHLGLGDHAAAAEQIERLIATDPAHPGAAACREFASNRKRTR